MVGDRLDQFQGHHPIGEQAQGPAVPPRGRLPTHQGDELGFLPPDMRARAQIIAPGTMITSQPLLPAPVPVRFPFPPYATRLDEVLGSADDEARANELLENM